MSFKDKTLAQILVLAVAGVLLSMSTVSIFSMGVGMDGTMSDCPLMPGMNVCPMSPLEHIATLQSLFTVIPQQQDVLLALLLAATFLALAGIYRPKILLVFKKPPASFYRYRNRTIPGLFQELFSSGILNTKLYS